MRHIENIVDIENGWFSDINDADFTDALIERDFEYVRRSKYPFQPSRLQSVFACSSINAFFTDWPALMADNFNIFEISAERFGEFDASLLKGYSYATSGKLSESTPGYENICKYWQGKCSDSPRLETLAQLPVRVNVSIML